MYDGSISIQCLIRRLQKETSTREQLWTKSSDLDERLKKLTERNDRLVDDLRDSETAAATANGESHTPRLGLALLWVCNGQPVQLSLLSRLCNKQFHSSEHQADCSMCLIYYSSHKIEPYQYTVAVFAPAWIEMGHPFQIFAGLNAAGFNQTNTCVCRFTTVPVTLCMLQHSNSNLAVVPQPWQGMQASGYIAYGDWMHAL